MRKSTLVLVVTVLAVLVGAGAYLATWEIPPPTTAVEKVLPDERFPR
ncbi:MAG: hypothetical protein IID48_00810 [Proteobacteria bacterium]|nr:hypothetical protein [Pseudomonadota bacterium]